MTSWFEYTLNSPCTKIEVLNQLIWFNSCIKIDKNIIFYKAWYEKGVKYVKDLVLDNRFLTHSELEQKYNLNVNFVSFNGIIHSIPKSWKEFIFHETCTVPCTDKKIDAIIKCKKVCKMVYPYLVSKHLEKPRKAMYYWSRTLHVDMNDGVFAAHFAYMYKLTSSTKLQYFQYRLLHNILPTNKTLYNMKIIDNPQCNFCNSEEETMEHLFMYCSRIICFWDNLNKWLGDHLEGFTVNSFSHMMLGNVQEKHYLKDFIYLVAKHYIYWCGVQSTQPVLKVMIDKLNHVKSLEKYVATKNNNMHLFLARWQTLKT